LIKNTLFLNENFAIQKSKTRILPFKKNLFPKTRTVFGFRRTALRRKLTTLFKVVFSNVALKRPEFKRAIHFLVESVASNMRRTEPVFVAINWDEMWIGVKGLSSLGLAGSPRKVCWH